MWYVYGETAIDCILHTKRADEVAVYSDSLGLSPSDVRTKLGLEGLPQVVISNEAPRRVINLDSYVLLPDGEVRDIDSGVPPILPLRLLITSSDLRTSDIERIERITKTYPEILTDVTSF